MRLTYHRNSAYGCKNDSDPSGPNCVHSGAGCPRCKNETAFGCMPGVTVPGMPATCATAQLPTVYMETGARTLLPDDCVAAPPSDKCKFFANTDWWSAPNLTRGISVFQVPFGLPDVGGMSKEQCCGLCINDHECEAANLDPSNQTCSLMSGKLGKASPWAGHTGMKPF